jgi:hypothetical protein
MQNEIYRGWLVEGYNGETTTLNLKADLFRHSDDEILADRIENDIGYYGRNLTVRYFITDKPVEKEQLEQDLAKVVMGLGKADYHMAYSDITGYLWTDEELNVGGHDLLGELQESIGKFLHMEIEYRK